MLAHAIMIIRRKQVGIMLKLLNLRKSNGIISAEYEPENSGEYGSISLEIKSGKVIEAKTSKLDSSFPIYLNHAVEALKKIRNEKELPKEKLIMWY